MFAATEKKLSLGLKLEGWTTHKISLDPEKADKGKPFKIHAYFIHLVHYTALFKPYIALV